MGEITRIVRGMAGPSGAGISTAQLAELQAGNAFTKTVSQNVASAKSNTSRTTYVDAMVYSLTLPSGSWTVEVVGEVELVNHGVGPSADTRILIAGNAGSAFSRTAGGDTPIRVGRPSHSRTGQTGTLSIRLQYKKSTGALGTLYAYAPALIIACKRTS